MKPKRLRKIGVLLMIFLPALYFGGVAVAQRNYWAGLFWQTYLPWMPAYDIIQGPKRSLKTRAQYDVATAFILKRSLTPATAKFCSFSEAEFGTMRNGGQDAMQCFVDMQNAFGATIRGHFTAVFAKDNPRAIEFVRWAGNEQPDWK